jgi:hypothetical protein
MIGAVGHAPVLEDPGGNGSTLDIRAGRCCDECMSISDGEVAELARQVVDRLDADLQIVIVPADPVDPYRWEVGAWTVSVGRATSYITADMSPDEVLAKLTADLGQP